MKAPLSPYERALSWISLHPGTAGANGLAKLILSLWNDDAAFSFRECIRSLDEERTALALDCVGHFAAHGEDQELVAVGYRVHDLCPQLWELGYAATEAKDALRAAWEREDRP